MQQLVDAADILAFSGKLFDQMPSIVAFQLKQIFNQNLIVFSKWYVY